MTIGACAHWLDATTVVAPDSDHSSGNACRNVPSGQTDSTVKRRASNCATSANSPGLALEMEQCREALALRQDWLMPPCVLGIAEGRKFIGQRGCECRPSAFRTSGSDRFQ